MMIRLSSILKSLVRRAEGATIIEFAIVAPVLFLLLMGMIELGIIFFTQSVIESATNIGARIGKTGFEPTPGSRETFIRDNIVRLSGGYLNPGDLEISILSYVDFTRIGQPETCNNPPTCTSFDDVNGNGILDADQGAGGPGGNGSIVLYTVSYPWPVFTPLLRPIIADATGHINLSAVATVRNEPF
jgi:Flp pilus assembly protein TadG